VGSGGDLWDVSIRLSYFLSDLFDLLAALFDVRLDAFRTVAFGRALQVLTHGRSGAARDLGDVGGGQTQAFQAQHDHAFLGCDMATVGCTILANQTDKAGESNGAVLNAGHWSTDLHKQTSEPSKTSRKTVVGRCQRVIFKQL
jgi:hypothetical protein